MTDGREERTRRVWAAWLEVWDAFRPRDGAGPSGHPTDGDAVSVALPWRSVAIGLPPERAPRIPGVAAEGAQRVTWIGFSPARGLVWGVASWDPRETARPPLPEEWRPVDRAASHRHLEDGTRHEKVREHHYRILPLPSGMVPPGVTGVAEMTAMVSRTAVRALSAPDRGGIALPRHVFVGQRAGSTLEALAWYAGNGAAEGIGIPLARQRRLQAAKAMPVFVDPIADEEVTAAVDLGRELVPLVSQKEGMKTSTARILAAASRTAASREPGAPGAMRDLRVVHVMKGALAISGVVPLLDAMPRDRLRGMAESLTEAGWNGLADMAYEIHNGFPGVAERVAAPLFRAEDGAGAGDGNTRDEGWGWVSGRANEVRWAHLRDLVDEFDRELVWPAQAAADPAMENLLETGMPGSRLAALALARIPPIRLSRLLDDHMAGALRRGREISLAQEDGRPAREWAVPSEPVVSPFGQVMRFLASDLDLAREGEAMRHCVADYADACASGRAAILSFGGWEDGVWHPSSTAEIGRDGSGDIEIVQHRGQGNGVAPAPDRESLHWWTSGIEAGEIPFDEAAIRSRGSSVHISGVLGEAWNTPGAWEARWDRWRRILGVDHACPSRFMASLGEVLSGEDWRYGETSGQVAEVRDLLEAVARHDRGMMLAARMAAPDPVDGTPLPGDTPRPLP